MADIEFRLPANIEIEANLRDEIIASLNQLEGVSNTRFEFRFPSLWERLSCWWDSQSLVGLGLVAVAFPPIPTEIVITISAAGGYIAKKAVDVIAELIRKRLEEKKVTATVPIYGPDGRVAKVVQVNSKKE